MRKPIFGAQLPPVKDSLVGDYFININTNEEFIFDDFKWQKITSSSGGTKEVIIMPKQKLVFEQGGANTYISAVTQTEVDADDFLADPPETIEVIGTSSDASDSRVMTGTRMEVPVTGIAVYNLEVPSGWQEAINTIQVGVCSAEYMTDEGFDPIPGVMFQVKVVDPVVVADIVSLLNSVDFEIKATTEGSEEEGGSDTSSEPLIVELESTLVDNAPHYVSIETTLGQLYNEYLSGKKVLFLISDNTGDWYFEMSLACRTPNDYYVVYVDDAVRSALHLASNHSKDTATANDRILFNAATQD